jgi:flagellar basal-body rod protein FlgB
MQPINMFGKTIQLLETTMDRRVESHRLISRNISNADTPNYSGTNLEFQKQLTNRPGRRGAARLGDPHPSGSHAR